VQINFNATEESEATDEKGEITYDVLIREQRMEKYGK